MATRKTKVAELRDRIEREEPPPPPIDGEGDHQGEATAAAPPPIEPGPSDMANVCRLPVMTLGAALCHHFRVPPLDAREVDAIAGSLAAVLAAHGVTVKDPRIVAWLTLGGAIALTAHPRVEFYLAHAAKPVDPPKPPANEAAAAPRADAA